MSDPKLLKLIEVAKSFIGVHESGGNNSGPVVEMFQRVIGKAEKEPWCVSFVQYCVKQVDLAMHSKTLLYPTESSQLLWKSTVKVARLTAPVPGAIVVFTKYHGDTPLSIGHVGIVTAVNGDTIVSCEGNTSPATGVARDGDGVFTKTHPTWIKSGYMRTTGYLLPWAG